jgi:hypothetical protein
MTRSTTQDLVDEGLTRARGARRFPFGLNLPPQEKTSFAVEDTRLGKSSAKDSQGLP